MSRFSEILSNIPPVIWSGALGSLITLLGVGFQNWFNGKRQREQLAHDAHQRNLQREMDLKREVFLAGAAAIAQMQAYFRQFLKPALYRGAAPTPKHSL